VAQIVIRNIPEGVMKEFRELARRRGRSMEAEVRALIAAEVERDERLKRFRADTRRRLRTLRAAGRTFSDSTELIREDRER
jgi:antitoxin FitA